MKKISISIMMHPSREKYLPYLRSKLGDRTPVAFDKINNIWDTCKRAWEMHDPTADYHIVVQDDTIIGKDFLKKIQEYMTEDAVYNFYIGRPRFDALVHKAKKKKRDRIVRDNIHHEICLGFPTHRINEMLAYCDEMKEDSDKVINKYVTSQKLKVIFTMPSLIDHRNEGSLHTQNKGNYIAKANWFVGE